MFYLILSVYLLGGLTFIPIIIITIGTSLYYFSPTKQTVQSSSSSESAPLNPQEDQDQSTKYEPDSELPRLYRAGWLTVRQTYEPSQNSENTYMGLLTNSYRNFMDQRSKDAKRIKPKDRFYGVLKQNVLFLYQDEDQVDCTAAIQVSLYNVDLYPTGCPDGELFVKKKAICLQPIIQPHHDSVRSEQPDHHHHQPGRPAAWFLFTKNNLEKEDWYHILLASSKLNGPDSKSTFQKDASLFDSQDMAKLLEGIDQQPDPIPMRWMNAMLGRLFLSSYRTHALENWIIDRIMKKLAKVQTPTFLSAINVREVNVGSTTPFFSKPMLKELTIDGDASMEVLVSYKGEFRITIETVATINLGARFKPYVVNLVLAVVLKELSGTLLLKIKRPPTNRLWFGFTAMPHLVFDLEPVVSTRQIKWALVLKPIESRIREVVMESIVYPNLDDLVFFDTQPYTHHGGIWGDAARKEKSAHDGQDDQGVSDGSTSTEEVKTKTNESSPTHKKSHSEPHQQPAPQTTKASLNTAREENNLSQDTMRQRTVKKNVTGSEESSEAVVPTPTAEESIDSSPTLSLNPPENKRSSWFSTTRRQDTVSTQSSQASASRNQTKARSAQQQPSDLEDGDAVAKLQKFLRSHPESSTSYPPTPNLDGKPTVPRVSEPANIDVTSASSPSNHLADLAEEPITPAQPVQSSSPQLIDDLTQQDNTSSPPVAHTFSNQSSEDNPSPLRRLPPPPRQTLPATFLPPPIRNTSNLRSANSTITHTATNQSTSSNSILNQLRTRATDKEALAASVTQARDVVIKWGAAWASKRKSPQAGHIHPYNNGFNPISIDHVQNSHEDRSSSIEADTNNHRLSSLTEPVDMDFSPISLRPADESSLAQNSSSDTHPAGDNEAQKSKSYRAHRARLGAGKAKSVDLSSPQSNSQLSRSGSPVLDHSSTSHLRPKPSTSKLLASPAPSVTTEEVPSSVGKRNRIFSSNGQFIPAAPQSTTGLSFPSAQPEGISEKTESKLLVPVLDDRSSMTSSPINIESISPNPPPPTTTITTTVTKAAPGILSERASYKPAPMMMIPGIKDSSHRFGIGSDSLTTQLQLSPNSEPAIPRPVVLNGSSSLGVVLADNRDVVASDPAIAQDRTELNRTGLVGDEAGGLGQKVLSQLDLKASFAQAGEQRELAVGAAPKDDCQDNKTTADLVDQPCPPLSSLADLPDRPVPPRVDLSINRSPPHAPLPPSPSAAHTDNIIVSKTNLDEETNNNNNDDDHNNDTDGHVDAHKNTAPDNVARSDDVADSLSPVDAAWGI
ncbi:hypothetical protein PTTG_08918 [Puccinia triticina 1-1 BBBD Race 1]|uniref:SMP-LTD domain-containing protein n=2 Tax=Puccinia triticina TaxID=208348 RepID=A0A180G9U4_PUCT1|nr:uncharacterized protein PtA15_3A211 [Puccinia triticina]OAV89269.1 hypothetical protein PTTG_08918 [Puccinia triticina 1-1 BBBD Race 1]WAQ82846.1 hypothetical protein PtA15_3A211 [Puccinia triticina]